MPRRIDVELTSARNDGTWTWRAAGARQPKGVVESSLLYEGAKVGDVVNAEVEIDIEGITILSVQTPKGKTPPPQGRIEIIAPTREFEGVTTSLAPKTERSGRRDRGERGDRPDRGDRGDRRDRPARPAARTSDRAPRPDRAERTPRPDRTTRPPRPPREEKVEHARPKRLSPGTKHRNAVVASLTPEQQPVAEQLLRGGIPSVRRAIEDQNTKARAEGLPEIKADQLVQMAEELLPRIKTAEWRDRAEAALADADTIGLRDLRSVASGADANARDEETRSLAGNVRDTLERRLKEEREGWLGEVTTALEEGRLVRALRVATRAPDPSMRFPADLAMRLSNAASEAMSSDAPVDRWAALLEAVAASPVRTTVKPAGLPTETNEAFMQAARQAAGRIPALVPMLGLSIPPPPRRLPPRPPAPPRPAAPQPAAPQPASEDAE